MPKGPRGPIEKPKDRKKVLLRLWTYIYAHKWMALAAVLLTVSSNLLALLGPMLSGEAIDAIGMEPGQADFPTVFFFCGLMIVFYAVSSLLSYILSILMIQLSQRIVFQMRQQVFNRLTQLPVRYFDGTQTGDIVSRISYDIDTVNASLSNDLLQIAASVITVVGSFIMMVVISPTLVLVFVITIPMSILFTRYMTKKVRPLFHQRSVKLGEMNGFVEEIITGQKTTKAYHQEETMISRFDQRNKAAVDAYYNADYYGGMTGPSVNFINNLSLAFVSIFGAILFLWGHLSIGNLSSFVLYSRRFSGPINEAANILSELQSACAAAERVFRLIDEEPEPADAPNAVSIDQVEGEVAMDHVRFGYDPGKTIIHNLSFTAPKGSLTAIVGPTGAGKTTLINLLMRFYEVNGGRITIDGIPTTDLTRSGLRRNFGMVLQDTWLFGGTIAENIAYGKPNATREEIVQAAKMAKVDYFIRTMPQGYDTVLDNDAGNLSVGQRQLLTIARVFLCNPPVLILDEATSSVDTRTEAEIGKAMQALMSGRTSFVIAHRLSTIRDANCILFMEQGNIIEQGTHKELLAKGGAYAALYNSQFA